MKDNYKLLLANTSLLSAYRGFTSVYLVAFALTLGASNTIVGLLGAIPWLAHMIMQIPGAELCQKYLRKHLHVLFGTLSKLFWLPILASPFLFDHPLLMVVIFYVFMTLLEGTSLPAILSLIADSVDEHDRGTFSGNRIKLLGLFGVISMSLGGLWLQQFPKESPVGFAIMFAFGTAIGMLSALVVKKIDEKPYQDHRHHQVKEFFTLTGQLKHFVIFTIMFNFARMLASPLFAVFFLENLEMSYEFFGIASAIAVLSRVLISGRIGVLCDKFGDKPVVLLATVGVAIHPILYLFVQPGMHWAIILLQLYSGFAWAALEVSHFNLLMGVTDPKRRAMQIAEYNLYTDIPMVIAPILGGWLSDNVVIVLAGIPLVFVISAVLRALSAAFLFKLEEPRVSGNHSAIEVLKEAFSFHPTHGITHTIHVLKRITGGLFR